MDFADSEEMTALRAMVRQFGEREIAPHVASWDAQEMFPREINKRYAELGLLGGALPSELGGSGMTFVEQTAVMEELAYFNTMAAMACGQPSQSLGIGIATFGSDYLKKTYLGPTLKGELIGAVAVTESHSGSDVLRHMATTATRDGDHYVLRGAKAWVSNIVNADWFLTFASLDKSAGYRGVCAFVVEKRWDGVETAPYHDKVGARTFVSGEVFLDNVRVPVDNRIGEEAEGYKVLLVGTEIGRLGCAARAVGQLRAVLDLSREYALQREVGGQAIGRFQLIQQKIALMSMNLEAGRLLTYKLAWLADSGAKRLQKQAAHAKLFTTETLMQAADDGMRIFGAASCSSEYKIGRLWRDAKFMQIYDGTNELQTILIAEHELGYRKAS